MGCSSSKSKADTSLPSDNHEPSEGDGHVSATPFCQNESDSTKVDRVWEVAVHTQGRTLIGYISSSSVSACDVLVTCKAGLSVRVSPAEVEVIGKGRDK